MGTFVHLKHKGRPCSRRLHCSRWLDCTAKGRRTRFWAYLVYAEYWLNGSDPVSVFHPRLDLILCKIRQCVDWIGTFRKTFALDVFKIFTFTGGEWFQRNTCDHHGLETKSHFLKLTLKNYHNNLVNHIHSKRLRLIDNIEHIDEKISKEEYIVMLNEQGLHVFASKVNFINT